MKKRIAYILAALMLAVNTIALNACDSDSTSKNEADASETVEKAEEKVIFENEQFKVTYLNFEDKKLGVTMLHLNLKAENNSDKGVLITFKDAYVNDTAIQFVSGFPLELLPGKNAVASNGFGYADKGIDGIEDVKKLEFKLVFTDTETRETIITTDSIVLEY